MKDYEELFIALRRITRAIDLHSKKLQREAGLTTSQLLLLEAAVKLDIPSPTNIAKEVLLSQATVTNLIDRMERNELILRHKSKEDKRVVEIFLTEKGKQMIELAPEPLQAGFLREYRKLERWEQHQLIGSMQRIAVLMDAEDIDASPILTTGELDTP
ncbi:MAG: MarR family transcriptional regulator [Gammaproteobacteria bacterium]|nr:MarR family transcriptional regulator [Gammaproteobacteria bacterium]MDG2336502.1 MarR family transcriptional regulator [Gammaproteobacteria bacterium]